MGTQESKLADSEESDTDAEEDGGEPSGWRQPRLPPHLLPHHRKPTLLPSRVFLFEAMTVTLLEKRPSITPPRSVL